MMFSDSSPPILPNLTLEEARLARHIAAENQYLRLVEFAGVEEFFPANLRTMNIGC
jgi:hypothetical protein